MKRIFAFLTALIMLLPLMTACNNTENEVSSQNVESSQIDENFQNNENSNDENSPNADNQTENSVVGRTPEIFSDYLDSVGFVEGLSQADLMSKVNKFSYNGTSVEDMVVLAHYDGESGGGCQANGELVSYYNNYRETDEGFVDYYNSFTTKVQLDGFDLPNGITFEDTVESVLTKCEIEMNPETDFVADDGGKMTLYSDMNIVIELIGGAVLEMIPEDPNPDNYMLKYSSTVPMTHRNGTVTTSLTMAFGKDKKLSRFTISVEEYYTLNENPRLLKEGKIESVYITSSLPGYEYSFDGEYVEPIVNYFNNLHLIADFQENPEEYVGGGWVITFSYSNGESLTVYHSVNKFIKAEDGQWYMLTYDEASEFDDILHRLNEEINGTSQPYVPQDESSDESSEDYSVNDESSNEEKSPEPQYNGLKIISGDQEILPFSCLLWAKIDHGDGTISEMCVDKISVEDVISGKTSTSVTEIPTVYLDNTITYRVQANGELVITHLWTEVDNGYTQREITFNDMAYLDKGVYFVSAEVLLNGNCDADAPQSSYRYEHIFRLVVAKNPIESEMEISIPDGLDSQILKESEKEIIFDILNNEAEWLYGTPDCLWVANFKGDFTNLNYCTCGTLSDVNNNRSRKLTNEEKESIEALISLYADGMSNSGI